MLIGVEQIQLVQPNLVELAQVKLVYIFLKIPTTYAQHKSLKQVTILCEQAALIVHTWPQTINSLVDLRSKYNNVENMLEDTNNQLQAHCLKLVNNKKALQNKEKNLIVVKGQLFKQ